MLQNVLKKVGLGIRAQNLDSKPGDGWESTGNILKHGRAWVTGAADRGSKVMDIEWVLGSMRPAIRLAVDSAEGPEISWHIGVPGFEFWVSIPTKESIVSAVRAKAIAEKYDGIDVINIRAHDGCVWWTFMHSDSSWHSTTPRWRSGSFDLLDTILGREDATREPLSVEDVEIPMPEGNYKWTIRMERFRVSRPRWFAKPVSFVFDAKCKEGQQIPVPGKGENSWDCGPDATFGVGASAKTVEEAIAVIVGGALKTRARRCGSHTYVEDGIHDPKKKAN